METGKRQIVRRRFTVHDYHRMGEAGMLHQYGRAEGAIVEMAAIGTRHFSCVNRSTRLLSRSVGDDATCRRVERARREEMLASTTLPGLTLTMTAHTPRWRAPYWRNL